MALPYLFSCRTVPAPKVVPRMEWSAHNLSSLDASPCLKQEVKRHGSDVPVRYWNERTSRKYENKRKKRPLFPGGAYDF